MMDVPLKCKCGKVRGTALGVSPACGNHGRCTCVDCRAFIQYLGRDDLLEDDGGIELFQFTPSQVRITDGKDLMRCLRLSEKGMIRWYTECCKTPIGNTMPWPKLPFVGMSVSFLDFAAIGKDPNEVLGPVSMTGFDHQATKPIPKATARTKVKVLGKMFWLLGKGFVLGRSQPSPYFNPDGTTPVPPTILANKTS